MEEHTTIIRKKEGEDTYSLLQKKALEDIQRLSGNVWTDYNLHDPGVTLLDVLNYGLLETDYRLGFPFPDYLVRKDERFFPQKHALYAPSEVFPVNPVTEADYRKLFISNIDDLYDVRVIVHPQSGTYDFVLDVWSDTGEARRKQIVKEVYNLYHSHRNLCEDVGVVRFLEYDVLYLCATIEVEDTVDANQIMARVFFETEKFLQAGMQEENDYDMAWLYQKLRTLPGITRIFSLSFMNGTEEMDGNLLRKSVFHGYALAGLGDKGHQLQFIRRSQSVSILWEDVQRQLYGLRTVFYGVRARATDKAAPDPLPEASYRDVFSHYPLKNDLPDCYRQNMNSQTEEYLNIFDSAIEELLSELQSLPFWMVPDASHLTDKKEQWMDVLDRIYGEDSNPAFLHNHESEQERRERRMTFLKNIPAWGLNRGKGMNLTGNSLKEEAGIETYFKSLVNAEKYEMEMFVVEHRFLSYRKGSFAVIREDAFRLTIVLCAAEKWLADDDFRQGCKRILAERIPAHIHLTVLWQRQEEAETFRSTYHFWKYSLCSHRKYGLEELSKKLEKELGNDNNWYGKV